MNSWRPFLAAWLLTSVTHADVVPAPSFGDHAVLQREKPVPVWGRADPGEKVVVTFAGQRREATTGPDGHWIAVLEPLATAAEGTEMVIAGRNTVTFRDVVVGEVWLCSGQSNMEWPLSRAADAAREIAAAQFPQLRHLRIDRATAAVPMDTVKTSGWERALPAHAGNFTAVGYFFARDLHVKLGVPVGIIHASWGGTPVEAWLSPVALGSRAEFGVIHTRWQQAVMEYPAKLAPFEAQETAWAKADADAQAKGKAAHELFRRQNPAPRAPRGGPGDPWALGSLFNGMINPLLPGALRGAIWYQGESNAERAAEYHLLFSSMITAWRAHFGQGDFPFYWVNLANYGVPSDNAERGRTFAFLREAQTKTLALPGTGQAIAIDLGDPKDIHPTNKQEVGRRLALLARNRTYGLACDDTGPVFESAMREAVAGGYGMRVRFLHASSGLIAHDKPVQSLELAGADRIFHPAQGRIDRETVWVTAPQVRDPVAVRYAWTNSPDANLYNGAGLPATPFRSDDW